MIFEKRWWIANVFLFFLGIGGWKYFDYPSLSNYLQFIIYNLFLILILIVNLFRIHNIKDTNISFNPYRHIPTTSSIFRTLTVFGLSFTLLTNVYSQIPVMSYLLYYYIIASTYDQVKYHDHFYRGVRIIFDIIFASVSFLLIGGIRNPAWLMFLIPITTVARHYKSWKPILTTTSCIIIVLVITLTFDIQHLLNVNLYELSINFGNDFNKYLTSSIAHYANWQSMKQLIIVILFFLVTTFIFQAETKSRIKKIFEFNTSLYDYISKKGKLITLELINKLCFEVNVESIIVIENNTLKYSFQTHTSGESYNERCIHGELILENNIDCKFKKWFEDISKYYSREHDEYKKKNKFVRWWLSDSKSYLDGNEEINQIVCNEAKHFINQFHDIFFNEIKALTSYRKQAELLQHDEIVAVVPIKINNAYILFINNLPTKFRIVQRVFLGRWYAKN